MIRSCPFSADLIGLVQGFNCGDDSVWLTDVNRWIKRKPESGECAISCISDPDRWCRVWLYFSTADFSTDTLVGYSSLGIAKWPLTESSKTRTTIGLIPYFGVDKNFHGLHHEEGETYAVGMFRDLLGHAHHDLDKSIEFLGLYVHQENPAGKKFWQAKCDFEFLKHHKTRDDLGTYLGMISRFRDGSDSKKTDLFDS